MKKSLTIELADGSTYTGGSDAVPGDVHTVDVPADCGGSPAGAGTLRPTAGQATALEKVADLRKAGGPAGMVIAGYAGVGKTTMLRLIAQEHGSPKVLTPTGKAALRVSQASGLPAETLHRWMYQPKEDPRTGRVTFALKTRDLEIPANRLVVVDEASMVGASLWADLWRAAQSYRFKVVLVGDAFQLPPVEPGKASPDFSTMTPGFAAERGFERVELTEVLRQAEGSPVIQASMRLRAGEGAAALAGLPRVQQAQLANVGVATYTSGGVIITYTNAARFRVNYGMRQMLLGANAHEAGPQAGEPLMCLRNNYDLDVYNGEQLTFDGWESPPSHQPREVHDKYADETRGVRFGLARVAGKLAVVAVDELSGDIGKLGGLALSLAAQKVAQENGWWDNNTENGIVPYLQANYGYCYTAHKAQGSEWPYALYVCEPGVKLNTEEGRRHAYTAVTRARTMAAVYYGRI